MKFLELMNDSNNQPFKLDHSYNYSKIEEHAKTNKGNIETYGSYMIGVQFLVLSLEDQRIPEYYSFVLEGYSNQAIYKCIYVQ